MRKVIITSDSTCDLSKELIEKYDIKIVPLYINLGNNSYKDSLELTTKELYEKIEAKEGFPKTSATTPDDFYKFFKPFLDEGCDIIYTGISSSMSCTFQNAHIAKAELNTEHIYLVDSQNLSTGIGLILLKAATYRDKGMSASEIKDKMEEIIPKVRAQFVLERLDYLYKGGRCSGMSYFIGSTLRIKPYIKVENGKMIVAKKAIGPMKKGLNIMIEDFQSKINDIDKEFLFITHSEAEESRKYIEEKIKDEIPQFENTNVTEAGCVVSGHCGKGCIGILYIMK